MESISETTKETAGESVQTVDSSHFDKEDKHMVWKPKKEEWLIMATMAVSSLLVALDSTILVPVLPTLATSLKGTTSETFWTGTSYLLANAVFQPFLATLSDVFGRRELLIPSLLLFLIGSVVCGVAHNSATMLTGRVLQGIAGGGLITLSQLVFADICPLRQRPKYFSIVLASWALGTVLGPLIGGALVEYSSWRWCFYLNIPICTIATLMAVFFVKLSTPERTFKEKIMQVDWLGNFMFISSLTGFLIAISWGGVQYSWSSWHTLVPLIIGTAGLILTVAYERYIAQIPFLRRALFRNWSAIFSYICAAFQGIALFICLYYSPFYFAAVQKSSPLNSGIDILPALCFILPGSVVVSALITRLNRYRTFIWPGWTIGLIGAGLLIPLNTTTSKVMQFLPFAVFGLGMGMVLSAVNFSVQAVVEPADAGRAASTYAFMRTLGMSLGVAIGGSVFQNFMKEALEVRNLPAALALNAEGLVAELLKLPAESTEKKLLLESYVHGFRGVWLVLAATCAVGLLASAGIKHFDMDRMLESKFTVRRREVVSVVD